jgi:hypothetical protein
LTKAALRGGAIADALGVPIPGTIGESQQATFNIR